jgi:transcriptional regulator with XRE-family HTH domain
MHTTASNQSQQPEPPATLGARIAAARRAVGLTQEQLGQGMGPEGSDLGKGAISSWEVDRSQPSAAQVALLASRLGVSADYLLGLTN